MTVQLQFSDNLNECINKYTKPNPTSWDTAKKEIITRIASLVFGFANGIAQATLLGTRSLQYLIGGAISFRLEEIQRSAELFGMAIIQGICLPIIGIIGLHEPKLAVDISKYSFFAFRYDTKQKYPGVIAIIMSLVNGFTFSPCHAVTGLMTLVAAPFTSQPEEYAKEAGRDITKAVGDIFCGIVGIFLTEPRENVFVLTQ